MIDNIIIPIVRELGWNIILNATLIMAFAAALTYKFRKSSAEVRYTIWGAAFLMLIVLPMVSYTVPEWTVLRIDQRATAEPVDTEYGSGGANSARSAIFEPEKTDETGIAGQLAGPVNGNPTEAVPSRSGNATAKWSGIVAFFLFSAWLVVAAALLARFVVQIMKVGRITKRAVRVRGGKLGGDIDYLIASLAIHRRVRVMLSAEVHMPFAWGIFHPVIILPIDAVEWPENRIQSVLTHELAHIARWDYLIHVIIEIVRALYWPNAAVWYAARNSVMERERACDDYALRSGTAYVDYAAHLLHIARMQLEKNVPIAAVTMAGEPGLKERISHVMNQNMNRSPLRRGAFLMTTALVALIALPIGSMAVKRNSWKIPTTKGMIKQLSESRNAGERSMAAWWLGEHEAEKAVDPLLDALNDESRSVRLTSGWALGEIKDRDSIDGLIETLETDEDLLVREMAVLALGEIEHPSAIDALEAAYKSDERLALAAVWALGEIAGRGSDEADDAREEIIDDLGERSWKNEQVWTGTLKRKGPRTRDVQNLIDDLGDDDEDVRCEAAFGLGKVGIRQDFDSSDEVETAVRALINALEDPVPEVRAMAIWSLDEINPSRKK